MKIVALADIHCRVGKDTLIHQLIGVLERSFDVLILAGDLTDTGLPKEAAVLAQQLQPYTMPILAILGNHDHESGQAEAVADVLREAGVTLLDGTCCQLEDVGFVGIKGFCGGFGVFLIQPFGEAALKTFVRTSIDEAARLENALAEISHCDHKLVILHYAPIQETLEGEAPELSPFLGTARLANAIDPQGAHAIVHGHAHPGQHPGL